MNRGHDDSARTNNVDRERIAPSPPTQTGQAVLPHPAFQFVAVDELAQARDSGLSEESHQPRRRSPRSPGYQAVHSWLGRGFQAGFALAPVRSAKRGEDLDRKQRFKTPCFISRSVFFQRNHPSICFCSSSPVLPSVTAVPGAHGS
jgi:hypothetical protein